MQERANNWQGFIVALAACLALIAPPAHADTPETKTAALRHFQIGVELVDARAWDAALAEFSRSRELFPTKNALKNAALCLRELGRHDEALDMYERLVRDFGVELTPADRKAVDDDVAKISRYTAAIAIDSDPAGAAVTIDGRTRGVTPLASPVRVTVGTRAVRVFKEGFAPFETKLLVASGETLRMRASLTGVSRVGKLRVSEKSGGAFEVRVDGAVVGVTPWQGTIAVGEHIVAIRGERDRGALPRNVTVSTGQTAEVVATAVLLPGELRIEPTPSDARVAIDGRAVASGAWSGLLPSGDHTVEITADWYLPLRRTVTVSSRRAQSIRPSLEQIRRGYIEVFAGPMPKAQYGVRGVTNCAQTCGGIIAGMRGGYRVTPHVGFELFLISANLSTESDRTLTAPSPNLSNLTTNHYSESADATFYAGGASVSYQLLEKTPLTFRFMAGAARGFMNLGATGVFGDHVRLSHSNVSESYWTPIAGPEVRFGYRFANGVIMDAGVGLLVFHVPHTEPQTGPPTGGDPMAKLPPGPSLDAGVGYCIPLTAALHFEL
jgi:hypothetical protein